MIKALLFTIISILSGVLFASENRPVVNFVHGSSYSAKERDFFEQRVNAVMTDIAELLDHSKTLSINEKITVTIKSTKDEVDGIVYLGNGRLNLPSIPELMLPPVLTHELGHAVMEFSLAKMVPQYQAVLPKIWQGIDLLLEFFKSEREFKNYQVERSAFTSTLWPMMDEGILKFENGTFVIHPDFKKSAPKERIEEVNLLVTKFSQTGRELDRLLEKSESVKKTLEAVIVENEKSEHIQYFNSDYKAYYELFADVFALLIGDGDPKIIYNALLKTGKLGFGDTDEDYLRSRDFSHDGNAFENWTPTNDVHALLAPVRHFLYQRVIKERQSKLSVEEKGKILDILLKHIASEVSFWVMNQDIVYTGAEMNIRLIKLLSEDLSVTP